MIIKSVILSGGSGTRLWPASRESYPKQLLPLTGERSLLQETAVRLDNFVGAEVDPRPPTKSTASSSPSNCARSV